ncbi:MAG: outer membrane beta-barrel protein, partial [Bacteroidales bacterium]|nr:outer membrane beta-barrel protein [Bacteroidales bacterium]
RLKYDHSHNVVDGYNNSETNYYENNVIDSTYTIDQKYHQVQKENTISVRASYTEPLGKNYFLQGTYNYSYAKNETEKYTYNYNKVSHEYSDLDSVYTNDYTGDFISQRAEIDLRKQEDKYNFMFGFSVQPSTTKSNGRGRDTTYNVVNFAPSARLDYRFSDTKFLSIWYQGKTGQPSLNQLLPIADNSNPLVVTEGNDRLNPSFNHDLSIDYRTNNKKNMSWFGLMADASYTKDNIINQKVYTDDGVLHNKYVNSDKGIYDFSARVMFNSRIAKSDFSVSSFFTSGYGNSVSYVSSKGKYVENETKTLNLRESLRLQYRADNLELMAGGDVNYKNAWYSVSSIDDIATWTNSIRGSVNWTFLKNFNISSDIRYTFYRGYSSGYGDAQTIWNASISKSFLHDAFTFKVAVYDMLDNAKSTYRTTTENYVQDVSNNTLGRYVMFTLTYRFGKFGGQGGMRMGPAGGPGGIRGHSGRGPR